MTLTFQKIPLRKASNSSLPPAISEIVSLQFYNKDGSGIKLPTKVDLALNKKPQETKT